MKDISLNEIIFMWNQLDGVLRAVLAVVLALLAVCAIVSIVISIYLMISYVKFNKKANSVGLTGEFIARKVLDDHGLSHIKVKCSGSILFGNSYSHYFKKVRLRRRTWKKASVSSLAMAVQKSCLAILDQENDPDMRTRVRLTPLICFGPVMCIPLIIIGVAIDMIMFKSAGTFTLVFTILGLVFYAFSFLMSLMVLRTEVKAQQRAYIVARESGLATEAEIADMKRLFKLYNIEYVNDMITALLELLLRILSIIAHAKSGSTSADS